MTRGHLLTLFIYCGMQANTISSYPSLNYLIIAFLMNYWLSRTGLFDKFCCALFLPDLFPVPTLITISANKLFLTDIDSGHTIWETSAKTNVKDICYTANDDKAYHITEDSLFILNVQNASMFQVFPYSLLYLRESGHYCHYFMANYAFEKVKMTRLCHC